jgi:hypothetical protein
VQLLALKWSEPFIDPSDPSMLRDGDFRPNVINTVVFIGSIVTQAVSITPLSSTTPTSFPIFVYIVLIKLLPTAYTNQNKHHHCIYVTLSSFYYS